ncbi:hypothetical protein RRG08_019305 [Elysia crispata]|uniref:Fucolectin-related molecule n=1 Tax=Elysia crispata TaxID=231223 RepID=A0AAE0YM47_9GAST|nr:hypothetical protein RRG08_019305 [Elysia crispata]
MVSVKFCILFITTLSCTSCLAQTTCGTNGWFGATCRYMCHCRGNTQCDRADGSCSSGCHDDWFGSACQYSKIAFTATGLSWLTDNDAATCNNEGTQPVNATLSTPVPITWIRAVVNDSAYLHEIQLNYEAKGGSTFEACTSQLTAAVDDKTVDIFCPTTDVVSQISLTGAGVARLCSLYISGGRNLALKQTTQQSSRFSTDGSPPTSWVAQNALDGKTGVGVESRTTCTHTDPQSPPGSWTVKFLKNLDVNRILLYNRQDCCSQRLVNFQLTALLAPNDRFVYNEPGGSPKIIYTVVPSPKISFPVNEVNVLTRSSDNILTLCEVVVFGENSCQDGQYGLDCERQCNCRNQTNCFIHSGGCPFGCEPGYAGVDCMECQVGRYGDDCSRICNDTCGGDNSCDRLSGACSLGCDPGYTGAFCETMCPDGTYGAGCISACSQTCATSCDYISGVCGACSSGFFGFRCQSECSTDCSAQTCNQITGACDSCEPGFYGHVCSEQCSSNCSGSDSACNRITGACESCELGVYGATCSKLCSVNCAGSGNSCDQEEGTCDEGCDEGYIGERCDVREYMSVESESDGSGGSTEKSWGIAATVVAVVILILAVVVVVVLLIRLRKASGSTRNEPSDKGHANPGAELGSGEYSSPVTAEAQTTQKVVKNDVPVDTRYCKMNESPQGHANPEAELESGEYSSPVTAEAQTTQKVAENDAPDDTIYCTTNESLQGTNLYEKAITNQSNDYMDASTLAMATPGSETALYDKAENDSEPPEYYEMTSTMVNETNTTPKPSPRTVTASPPPGHSSGTVYSFLD